MTPFSLFYLSSFPYIHSHFGLKKVSFAKQSSLSRFRLHNVFYFPIIFIHLSSSLKCVRVFYIIFILLFSVFHSHWVSCPLHFTKLQISRPFYIFVLHVYTCKVSIDIFSIHENVPSMYLAVKPSPFLDKGGNFFDTF
jgi:hypothetical protein